MKYKDKQEQPNARGYFIILGITFIPIGIATENPAFMILGLVSLVIGLINHRDWKTE
jgi:hypothetical protein